MNGQELGEWKKTAHEVVTALRIGWMMESDKSVIAVPHNAVYDAITLIEARLEEVEGVKSVKALRESVAAKFKAEADVNSNTERAKENV